jgi:glucose/arabinose dehydrogenase
MLVLAGCGAEITGHEAAPVSTVESTTGLRAREVVDGLDRPVYVATAPGEEGRLYVVEQAGVVRIVSDGRVQGEPFLDIRDLVETGPTGTVASEQGLLSIAFAPDYATSGTVYVDYSDRQGAANVVAYTARGGRVDPTSARPLLVVPKESARHYGGQLQLGPDGALYVSVGDDAVSQVHPQSLAPGDVHGKILRLEGGGWRVVAYGLRNPWRFSFDRETGDLWVGDVGESSWEEVSVVHRSGPALVNFGWDAYEGNEPMIWDEGGHDELEGPGELTWPVAVYGHDAGCSVIGGYVYRGSAEPALQGAYVFADYCSGLMFTFDVSGSTFSPKVVLRSELGVSAFGEDDAGELYLVDFDGGGLYRVGVP